jgi:chorismate synthase
MKIIITGPKGSGKTTLGRNLAAYFNLRFVETDTLIEELYFIETGKKCTFREVYRETGEARFREIEGAAAEEASRDDWCVISTGGGTMFDPELRALLRRNSILVLLKAEPEMLWNRIQRDGVPDFLSGPDGFEKLKERVLKMNEAVGHAADIVFDANGDAGEAADLADQISAFMMLGTRGGSTFGELIRVTTFGESHGRAVGAVLDGLKPGIPIDENDLQAQLDRRKPGQSEVTTRRNEDDRVQILSGVFEGRTTGTPICMVIYNKDQDSSKYDNLKGLFRPGHADFTFYKKYGVRDHRGGGRSSGRETAGRVCAGAAAKKILAGMGVSITAFAEEIAGVRGTIEDFDFIEKNPVRSADPEAASLMTEAVVKAKNEKDSVGGIVKLVIRGVPAGLGDPVFYKLDARLGAALFSIGAVKGVEFGAGFSAARMKGSENNDPMTGGGFVSNNAGGILGGISSGADIIVRAAVKPTPSIFRDQKTIDENGNDRTISIEGRHDPCIVPRIIPVIESMAALVLLDAWTINENLKR